MVVKHHIYFKRVRRQRRIRGAVTLEFALTMPIMLWILFGICEYGMALNAMNTITQLARDGARYAAVHATESNCYSSSSVSGSTRAFLVNESKGTAILLADSNVAMGYIDDVPTSHTYRQFVVGNPTTPGKAWLCRSHTT